MFDPNTLLKSLVLLFIKVLHVIVQTPTKNRNNTAFSMICIELGYTLIWGCPNINNSVNPETE